MTGKGDVAGGLMAAIVGLPQAVALGIAVFLPLGGEEAVHIGVAAGIVAVVVGGIFAALIGGAPVLISGPRASTALILAGLVHELRGVYQAPTQEILTWVFLTVLLAGLLQVAMAALHADRLIRRIPEPVVSGFGMVIGLLILLDQILPMIAGHFGKRPTLVEAPAVIASQYGWAAVVGVLSLAIILLMARCASRKARIWHVVADMAPAIGIAVGVFLFEALRTTMDVAPGQTLAQAAPGIGSGTWSSNALHLLPVDFPSGVLEAVFFSAALLSVMGAIDSIVAATQLEIEFDAPFDARRELFGQGLANIASAVAGGVAVAGSLQRGMANGDMGGRSRAAGVAAAIFIALMVTIAWPLVGHLPLAALGAVMAAIGWQMVQKCVRRIAEDWRREGARTSVETLGNSVVVGGMALFAVLGRNPLYVILIAGLSLNILMLLWQLSDKTVYRYYPASRRHSLERRSIENRRRLRVRMAGAHVLELEGDIFFGTALTLREWIEQHYKPLPAEGSASGSSRFLVIDFSRVHEIDSTGAGVLVALVKRLQKDWGVDVWLSYLPPQSGKERALLAAGMSGQCPKERWKIDTEHAIEAIEDSLLAEYPLESGQQLAFHQLPLCAGLSDEACQRLESYCSAAEDIVAGKMIYAIGDPADRIFILGKGDVRLSLAVESTNGSTYDKRLAALNPGAMFGGDVFLLENDPPRRIANALAREDSVVWSLTREKLAEMEREVPDLAARVYRAAVRDLADRIGGLVCEGGMADA